MTDTLKLTGTIELTNQLGMRINANVESIDDAYQLMRALGRSGWTSGEIPRGGLILPYEMADTFDWNLIGAREIQLDDVEDGQTVKRKAVVHRGLVYKRRDCPSRKIRGKTMPDMVKYSRGAKDFDSSDVKENEDDTVQYVTLVTFRGNGKGITAFKKP